MPRKARCGIEYGTLKQRCALRSVSGRRWRKACRPHITVSSANFWRSWRRPRLPPRRPPPPALVRRARPAPQSLPLRLLLRPCAALLPPRQPRLPPNRHRRNGRRTRVLAAWQRRRLPLRPRAGRTISRTWSPREVCPLSPPKRAARYPATVAGGVGQTTRRAVAIGPVITRSRWIDHIRSTRSTRSTQMSTARSQEGGREVSHYLRSLAKRMVRVTRYVAGYVRWLFVFERRVRAAVDQDRARGPYRFLHHTRLPASLQPGARSRAAAPGWRRGGAGGGTRGRLPFWRG